MTKEEALQKYKESQEASLNQLCDDCIASVEVLPPVEGGFSQADMDAAVASARAEDQAALDEVKANDAQVLADAIAAKDVALENLKASLDAMTAKDVADIAAGVGVVADAQAKFQTAKEAFDAVLAIVQG